MKIIIVPHTHWDREWYFTNEVSQVLLKFNLDNFLNNNYPISKFYLDGQLSLVEDYLLYANKKNKNKFLDLINAKKIIVGPLYSQPDVFNSLGETTIRNIKIANKIAKEFNIKSSSIFYCPDTFGFGFNLPQILRKYGFDKFVFWRGLSKYETNDDYLEWIGIEGSKINAFRYKFGYWILGPMFPWQSLEKNNIKKLAKVFLNQFEKSSVYLHLQKQAEKYGNKIILPFGGDQAPIHPLTNDFFKQVNKESKDEWVIGEIEEFFINSKVSKTIQGTLDYGYESKIHRTISSSRYDFKKLFRENEINLYHQLEPLELFYKYSDPKYYINNDEIIKTLTLMQAHDVLGGCVTDNTFQASLQKLLNIYESIEAKKQLLMKQISLQLDLKDNHILIFNPNVNSNSSSICYKKIYTKNKLSGYYEDQFCKFYIINSVNFSSIENTYESEILLINKAIHPLNIYIIDLNNLKSFIPRKNTFLDVSKYTNFIVKYDNGDLFDADEDSLNFPKVKVIVVSSEIITIDQTDIIEIKGNIVINQISNSYIIKVTKFASNDEWIDITIDNCSNNIIVKWIPSVKPIEVSFLQHLGISKYKPRVISDWLEEGYKENPINIEKNSGLIFDKDWYICTRGTNEFSCDKKNITITLFRSIGVLGKADLVNRPGVISGLVGHSISTPLAQLKKTLYFHFKIGNHNNDVDQKLNSFYKSPIIYHVNSNNLIDSKMERFVVTKKDFTIKYLKLDIPYGFVSSLNYGNNKINLILANWKENEIIFRNKKIAFNKFIDVSFNYE